MLLKSSRTSTREDGNQETYGTGAFNKSKKQDQLEKLLNEDRGLKTPSNAKKNQGMGTNSRAR